ncbi:hypothetical protein A2U01_0062333, partial [Trifolium medium]|nr:hypothetical protein [Trifolium medium]
MLRKVLGKGRKTTPPHDEELLKKKISTRASKSGKGSSRQQPQQPQPQQQEQQR